MRLTRTKKPQEFWFFFYQTELQSVPHPLRTGERGSISMASGVSGLKARGSAERGFNSSTTCQPALCLALEQTNCRFNQCDATATLSQTWCGLFGLGWPCWQCCAHVTLICQLLALLGLPGLVKGTWNECANAWRWLVEIYIFKLLYWLFPSNHNDTFFSRGCIHPFLCPAKFCFLSARLFLSCFWVQWPGGWDRLCIWETPGETKKQSF